MISKATVNKYFQVPKGVNENDFDKIISDAINIDLKQKVSADFFSDLQENYKEQDWKVIFFGGDYTCDGKNYNFVGLERIISGWVYARYKEQGNTFATSFGFTQKTNPSSEPVSQQDLDRQARRLRQDNDYFFRDFEAYLRRVEGFEKYCVGKGSGMPKIEVIK